MTDLLQPPVAPTWRDHLVALRARCTPARMAGAAVLVAVSVVVGVMLLRQPAPPVPLVLPRADAGSSAATAVGGSSTQGKPSPGPATPTPGAGSTGGIGGTVPVGPAGTGAVVTVHAAGRVTVPGVYALPDGSRLADLVTAAGGLAADADVDRLNLAARLVDGERVYVPHRGEADPPQVAAPAGGGGSPGGSKPGPGAISTGPVDLNRATAVELDALPGVGPATASAIIEYRERNGRFRSVAELLEVPGIGPAKLEALRPLVRV